MKSPRNIPASLADKLEAMVKLGMLKSRMKDSFDIWLLSRHFDSEGTRLADAVRLAFERRHAALPAENEAFSEPFI